MMSNSVFSRHKKYCYRAAKCERVSMQDCLIVGIKDQLIYFILCDGHGISEKAAHFVMNSFKTEFETNKDIKNYTIIEIRKYLTSLAKNVDQSLKEYLKRNNILNSGTTMVIVLLTPTGLVTLNIGDSLILVNQKNKICYRNVLHTPTNPSELERIKQRSYVKDGRIESIINISRTFGDFEFKDKDKKNYYNNPIIVDPDVNFITKEVIESPNSWCLMASDGLYLTFLSSNISYEIQTVINYLLLIGFGVNAIVNILITECIRSKIKDNVSIILILLSPPYFNMKEYERYILVKKIIINNFSIWLDSNRNEWKNKIGVLAYAEKHFLYFLKNFNIIQLEDKEKILFKHMRYNLIDLCCNEYFSADIKGGSNKYETIIPDKNNTIEQLLCDNLKELDANFERELNNNFEIKNNILKLQINNQSKNTTIIEEIIQLF